MDIQHYLGDAPQRARQMAATIRERFLNKMLYKANALSLGIMELRRLHYKIRII
jgi:hypothetical protein